jgi:uncharacterized protein
MSTTIEKAIFPDLGKEQCIALTTFRKTGQAVTTPVWFAERLGTIYVETYANEGKVKRLRHTAHVTLAPCTYSGKITGAVSEGNARILTASQESATAQEALSRKYGLVRRLYYLGMALARILRRQPKSELVYIAIEPIAG